MEWSLVKVWILPKVYTSSAWFQAKAQKVFVSVMRQADVEIDLEEKKSKIAEIVMKHNEGQGRESPYQVL